MTVVAYIGAIIFGLVLGWITSRLLARREGLAHVSHFAAVVAAAGGGYVTVESGNQGVFGLYAIGLVVGFAAYVALFHRRNNDRAKTAALLGVGDPD